MEIQADLGSDIAMLFDECPPYPCDRKYAEASLGYTCLLYTSRRFQLVIREGFDAIPFLRFKPGGGAVKFLFFKGCGFTVSYTHLDVYKRQFHAPVVRQV